MVKLTKQPMRAIISLIAVIFASMQIYMMENWFESDVLFYKSGATGPKIFYIAVAAVIVIALIIGVVKNAKYKKSGEQETVQTWNGFTLYFGILSGFLLIIADYFHIKNMLSSTDVATNATQKIASYVGAILAFVAIPAAVYFLYLAFFRGKNDNITLVCGVCVIVWALLYVMKIYFNLNSALLSPIRILNQLAPLSIMLYFVYDLRQRIKAPKPVFQFTFGFIAVLMIALNSSAELYMFFTKTTYAGEKLVFSLAELAMGVFIVSGLRFEIPKSDVNEADEESVLDEEVVDLAPDAVPNENTDWWKEEEKASEEVVEESEDAEEVEETVAVADESASSFEEADSDEE